MDAATIFATVLVAIGVLISGPKQQEFFFFALY